MNSGIYKIENLINHKIYIGKSIDIRGRWSFHKCASHWDNSSKILYQAFKKYGLENFSFEVLENINPSDKELLNQKEQYWIKYYDSYYNGYNQTKGGDGDISDNRVVSEFDIINIRTKYYNTFTNSKE